MPDSGLTLAEIAARLGGDVLGDGQTRVFKIASLASAGAGEISFLADAKHRKSLRTTGAAALILPPAFADFERPRIITDQPYAYYARLATLLNPPKMPPPGIDPTARSASSLPASASIGAQVVLGEAVVLGERVILHPGCVIGDRVRIGDDSVLYPQVSIYPGCVIGRRAVIHSGAVIGADGFGFASDQGRWVKIPQLGGVVVGDDVEIGANTSIDRGSLDDTIIGDGVKLDNQIQIGHNCRIGEHTVIAGCVGIAGSARIGKNCLLGGAAMILGHLEIADGTVISPGSMVMKSITRPGKYTALLPLEPHEHWRRNAAQMRHLARLAERLSALEASGIRDQGSGIRDQGSGIRDQRNPLRR